MSFLYFLQPLAKERLVYFLQPLAKERLVRERERQQLHMHWCKGRARQPSWSLPQGLPPPPNMVAGEALEGEVMLVALEEGRLASLFLRCYLEFLHANNIKASQLLI